MSSTKAVLPKYDPASNVCRKQRVQESSFFLTDGTVFDHDTLRSKLTSTFTGL
jgi:hypothetical protein